MNWREMKGNLLVIYVVTTVVVGFVEEVSWLVQGVKWVVDHVTIH